MRITQLKADAFCTSIEMALSDPPDIDASIRRIRNTLNRLPEGKLILSDTGSNVNFFSVVDGKQCYVRKRSEEIYSLARRRYQSTLLEILKLTESSRKQDAVRRAGLITRMQKFIRCCEKGNLDLARIVLTKRQYDWFTGDFRQKPIDESEAQLTARNLPVRSKSERDIIDKYDDLAVPVHYEEQMVIQVGTLVDQLEEELLQDGGLDGYLYYWNSDANSIHWNVPADLEWMNARGSIWKTYYPPRGTIRIYPDIKGMFADSSIFIHEHEGKMDDFVYRKNASERAFIMKFTGAVSRENFIETLERDVDTPEKRCEIIKRRILPRLWF